MQQCQFLNKSKWIFAKKDDGNLQEFRAFDADSNIKRVTTDLQDTALLTRIEVGNFVA